MDVSVSRSELNKYFNRRRDLSQISSDLASWSKYLFRLVKLKKLGLRYVQSED